MRRVCLALLGMTALSVAACSASPMRRTFKESARDSMIKTAVRYQLSKDRLVKARYMEIDVWRGVVTLHGRTMSGEERVHAEEVARQVKHVVAVENNLKVIGEPIPVAQGAPMVNAVPPSNALLVQIPAVASAPKPIPATKPAMASRPAIPATRAEPTDQRAQPQPKPSLAAVEQRLPTMPGPRATAPVAPRAPVVSTTVPAPMSRPRSGGKTLPWLGEFPDEEGPSMQPVKEIAETGRPAVGEDLAREAAEELKRLKGTPSQ